MKLVRSCVFCQRRHSVVVEDSELAQYRAGSMVQDAFPTLSADDRELFFVSGICGKCFDNMFKE